MESSPEIVELLRDIRDDQRKLLEQIKTWIDSYEQRYQERKAEAEQEALKRKAEAEQEALKQKEKDELWTKGQNLYIEGQNTYIQGQKSYIRTTAGQLWVSWLAIPMLVILVFAGCAIWRAIDR